MTTRERQTVTTLTTRERQTVTTLTTRGRQTVTTLTTRETQTDRRRACARVCACMSVCAVYNCTNYVFSLACSCAGFQTFCTFSLPEHVCIWRRYPEICYLEVFEWPIFICFRWLFSLSAITTFPRLHYSSSRLHYFVPVSCNYLLSSSLFSLSHSYFLSSSL